MDGLHDDFRDFIIRMAGSGHYFRWNQPCKGKLTVVVKLIKDHTDRIRVHSQIHGHHGIHQFRRCVRAEVSLRKGSIPQRIQTQKTQITNAEFLLLRNINVTGLQVRIQITGLTAYGKRRAKIQAQVHCLQMGESIFAHIFFQRAFVAADEIHFISQTPTGNGLHLPTVKRQKTFDFGKILQDLCFLQDVLSLFAEIFHGIAGVFIGTCQKKGFKLCLTGRYRNDFYNVFFICILLNSGTADHTMMFADGVAEGEAIQQRRNVIWL